MDTLTTKTRFVNLRAKGWSFDKIAKETGKAKQTLIDWSKELQDGDSKKESLRAGGSLETAQFTLRHSNPATTQIYTATLNEEQRPQNSGEALIR